MKMNFYKPAIIAGFILAGLTCAYILSIEKSLIPLFFVVMVGSSIALLVAWLISRSKKSDTKIPFIEKYEFPETLYAKCQQVHLSLTESDFQLGVTALRQYFIACLNADGAYLAMPSKLADTIWHQFILHTREYTSFCNTAFGRYLHHEPDNKNGAVIKKEKGLVRAWDLCAAHEGANGEIVPLLFRVDSMTQISNAEPLTRNRIESIRKSYYPKASTSSGDSTMLVAAAMLMASSSDNENGNYSTDSHSDSSGSDSSSCGSGCGS